MKKMLKKLGCFCLSVLLAFSIGGCGKDGDDKEKIPKGLPNYEADVETKEVRFGGWSAPAPAGTMVNQTESYITVENYRLMKEAGLYFVNGLYERDGNANQMLALDCAKEAGMKYLAYWPSLINMGSVAAEDIHATIKKCLDHEACMGIFIKDEPHKSVIDQLGMVIPKVRSFTNKYTYVNLFPCYATSDQTGFTSYRDYLNYYCAKTKNTMISVDIYPYEDNGMHAKINPEFLYNLEADQKYAMAYGMEHWEFLQSIGNLNSMYVGYDELSHQIYTSMAFGAHTLQYFCVFHPDGNALEPDSGYGQSLFSTDGKPTELYNCAKKINGEIHKFDHVFMNYVERWQGVLPVVGKNNTEGKNSAFNMLESPLSSYSRIDKIVAEEDTVVGCFKDKDGYDGFLAVNYSVPADEKEDKVEFTFKEADKAVVYIKGEYSLVDLTDGKLELTLEKGQGAFVIPVKS